MSTTTVHEGILVGIDGSSYSETAVRWAVGEAVMRNVPLSIVYVIAPLIGGFSGVGMSGASLPEDIDEWLQDEAQGLVQDSVRIAHDSAGGAAVQIRTEIPFAPVVPTLIDLSKQAQLVVVGSHGQGALARELLGSVSSALIQHSHCPVAVLHEQVPANHRDAAILVGVDGSPASEQAVALAFDEASFRRVDLVALHAWCDSELPQVAAIPWSAIFAEADKTLAERLAGWQERYPDVVVRKIVVRDHPVRNLLAESESAQLVVLGTHGRGGFAGMLVGSVSRAVAHGSRSPVIVARHD
jgi:nucleotide-binding universal stress UspA family protein